MSEIASSATRNQNLDSQLAVLFEQHRFQVALGRADSRKNPRCSATDNHYIPFVFHLNFLVICELIAVTVKAKAMLLIVNLGQMEVFVNLRGMCLKSGLLDDDIG